MSIDVQGTHGFTVRHAADRFRQHLRDAQLADLAALLCCDAQGNRVGYHQFIELRINDIVSKYCSDNAKKLT